LVGIVHGSLYGYLRPWRASVYACFALVVLILIVYWSGVRSAVFLWLHSSSYNHSLLILPTFFYLLWSGRAGLIGLAPRPSPWGGGVILGFAGLWLLSFLSGVAEGVQFAIVGMIQGMLLTLFGGRIYLRLLLPFSYLWLLVPSGEALVPTLQLVTAKAATWMLDLAGIVAFRDGIGIEVPSGSYLVAPACAGLNFVLAGLAASMAYAELIYRTWLRRAAFILAILVLAVAGNALRVFLIIAIAHVTDNVGNIAGDHILYGWAFFSVLLLGAMALGQRFRQDGQPLAGASSPAAAAPPASLLMVTAFAATLLVAAPAGVWLWWPDGARPVAMPLPSLTCGSWAVAAAGRDWPAIVGQVDGLVSIDCEREGRHVHLVQAALDRPIRLGRLAGAERWLAASGNWSRTQRKVLRLGPDGIPLQADIEVRGERKRLVWSLF
jgi:exosortase